MAASSSSSSSSSSTPPPNHQASYCGKWEYDFFLCFRFDDTGNGFTSHLREALDRKEIKAFIDDMLEKTESIDELTSILQRSALSIVIFSQNFAESTWCLDQVAAIARSMEQSRHRVIPVFYEVDPSDVSGDSGRYAITISRSTGKEEEKKKRWMDALKAVAMRAGFTSQKTPMESDLVKLVVEEVQRQLTEMSPSIMSKNLVGIDSRLVEIERLLAMNALDGGTRIVGLWGMGGSGKTTLATACYERLTFSVKDTKQHFLKRINEQCESGLSGAEGLIQELYSSVLSLKDITRVKLDNRHRKALLSRSKVFIVLDDVETISQLDQLLLGNVSGVTSLFGPGSRIVVTTRNKKVLQYARAKTYHVDGLSYDESLQLFSLHAFRQELPPDNWRELSHQAISCCSGNPLALKVMGSRLFGEDQSYWKSFLGDLVPGVHDVLVRSYNKLGADAQEIFLDVAYFHNGWSRSAIADIMTSKYDYHAHSRVKDLIDESMFVSIVTGDSEEIHVHDLLREMAWKIINDERKLENRSRLKNPEEVHKLLTTWNHLGATVSEGGGRATEAILLDISKASEMNLKANAFEGLHSLTFLVFWSLEADYYRKGLPSSLLKIHLPSGGLDSLPDELRYLHWDGFPSKSLPSRFDPEHLCYLIIRHSPIELCWEGAQPNLANLMCLDLSYCKNLTTVPDLSNSSNLWKLLLLGCKCLVELPLCVQYLNRLVHLDLRDCTNLRLLPDKLDSTVLKYVNLSNCPNITRCPEINSGHLEVLNLEGAQIRELPSAIYQIKQGGILYLCGKDITEFPEISASLKLFQLCHTSITEMDCYDHDQGSLSRFVQLKLVNNPQLKTLSRNIWKMVSKALVLEDCPSIESLPEISQLVHYDLTELLINRCGNLKSFPTGISNLKSLKNLVFTSTDIKTLPPCIEELDHLSCLSLCYSQRLESVPGNIHKLAKLSTLLLRGCSSIPSLPELPPNLEYLDVGSCKSLRALPSNIKRLAWKHLLFDDCPELDMDLPQQIVQSFPSHATMSLHLKGDLQYSGNEIPEWFANTSGNAAADEEDCRSEELSKGIAFGVVVCSSNISVRSLYLRCNCIVGTTFAASWRSPGWHLGETSSDTVYLWYDKNVVGEGIQEPWYVRHDGLPATFSFSLRTGNEEEEEKLQHMKIKRAAMSLLF